MTLPGHRFPVICILRTIDEIDYGYAEGLEAVFCVVGAMTGITGLKSAYLWSI
jgi:hypothetical protein